MHIMEFGGLILMCGLACIIGYVQAEEADVKVVSAGYCSSEVLKKKGVDPSKYKSKISFDPKKIRTIPEKPTVPGCFRLIAHNVTLKEHVSQVTAEFEMRVAGSADPNKPMLQCKKRQPKCGCGEKDACMYCDFCRNFKKFVHEGKVNNKEINVDQGPTTCDCNVPSDTYSIDVEVCTPDDKEIGENVPTEVINAVSDGKAFSLFTTLFIYDFRFNSLANSDKGAAAANALKARKAKGLIGCYIVGTNVSM